MVTKSNAVVFDFGLGQTTKPGFCQQRGFALQCHSAMASPDSTISQIAMPIPREPSLFNQKCGCTVSEAAQPWKPCRKTTRKIQHKKKNRWFCYGHLVKKITCPGHSDRTHWQKKGHCRVPHLHQGEHKVHNFNTFPLRFKRVKMNWQLLHEHFECEFPKSFPA